MRLMVSPVFGDATFENSDFDKGLLDHTWSDYRGVNSSNAIKSLVAATYAAYGQ